jgi:hypothetical protein
MDMTDEEKLSAIKAIDSSSNQSTYNKYAAAVKAGISVSDWSNLASSISGTVSQAKLQEALKALGWSKSKCSAAWDVYSDANGWKKENPYK